MGLCTDLDILQFQTSTFESMLVFPKKGHFRAQGCAIKKTENELHRPPAVMPCLIRHPGLAVFPSICRCSKCLNQRMLGGGAFGIICSNLLFSGPEAPKPNTGRGSTAYWCQGWELTTSLALSLWVQHPQEGGCPSCAQVPFACGAVSVSGSLTNQQTFLSVEHPTPPQ